MVPGLMSLEFDESGVQPACEIMWRIPFYHTLGSLAPTEYPLNTAAYLSTNASLYDHSVHILCVANKVARECI